MGTMKKLKNGTGALDTRSTERFEPGSSAQTINPFSEAILASLKSHLRTTTPDESPEENLTTRCKRSPRRIVTLYRPRNTVSCQCCSMLPGPDDECDG